MPSVRLFRSRDASSAQGSKVTFDQDAEKWRRRAVERFIPKTFTRVDAEDRVNLLDDLGPLIKELEGMVTVEDWKNRESTDPTSKPRRGFRGIVRITSSDEADSISVVRVWLRLWSYESFKRAEEGFAENVAMINIALQPGSLTGQEVGELTRHNAEKEAAAIIFLRRNVVASLACRAEIYSVAMKDPSLPLEGELKSKCENFAKKIDEAVIRLTNQ